MGVGGGGGGVGHTGLYRGYSSDCHMNIVGYLLTKWPTKGGLRAPRDPPGIPLATPLSQYSISDMLQMYSNLVSFVIYSISQLFTEVEVASGGYLPR